MTKEPYTNQLIHESSPYLLQHAHNPVEWHPWNKTVLDKALKEDKLVLLSIGYSACHWCHVMAHECFEDQEVASMMNEHFICIKVDREERPDVDHFFMTAVQLMGAQGGWPLNVITLPDGQPFWGGTYFPKPQWLNILNKIRLLFSEERDKVTHYAHRLTTGIQQTSLINNTENEATAIDLSEVINDAMTNWSPQWDLQWGGSRGKPKFPMPVNFNFLIHLNYHHPQDVFREFVEITLGRMARGGIYDQIGGGFARYSVDEHWKVPHFEKMLYDNALLIGLYSDAYALFGHEEYKQVVNETITFIERELMHPSGAFFSALDADSEGEEGKYYVWTKDELINILKKDFPLFSNYFNINEKGHWKNGQYILMRTESNQDFAKKHNLSLDELQKMVIPWKKLLLSHREKRSRPGLDDKTVTSWNSLMILGLCKAFKAIGEQRYRDLALKNGNFLSDEILSNDGHLKHIWKNGQGSINGFMEDYATVIPAFTNLYEITGDESWIIKAIKVAQYAEYHFYDEVSAHFRFMEKDQKELPSTHFEIQDNVVPSANSIMGHALYKLSLLTYRSHYRKMAEDMLQTMLPQFRQYPWSFANWGDLMLLIHKPTYEVVIAGPEAEKVTQKMQKKYRPDIIWAPLLEKSAGQIEIVKSRKTNEQTTIYICSEGTCKLPVHSIEEAEKLLKG